MCGIDAASYYRQTPEGAYIDTTGCGNTIDFSLPAAQRLVLDSLRYWAAEMHVDGFRFDLAAALARSMHDVDMLGSFMTVIEQDLVDVANAHRHDSAKLAAALVRLQQEERQERVRQRRIRRPTASAG